jgi:hypothetical protein
MPVLLGCRWKSEEGWVMFSMVSMDFHSFPTIFWCKTWRMMLCHYSGGKSWFGVWQMMASLSFYGYVTSYRWDEIRAGLTIFR